MHKQFTVGKVLVDMNLAGAKDGMLCIQYRLSSVDGATEFGEGQTCVDIKAIHAAVMAQIQADGPVGWSLKDIKRKARSVTNRVTVNKIARTVAAIATDPRFQKGAAMASAIYPPLGIPAGVAVKTAKMYQEAQQGHPGARDRISRIVADARAGNPKAQDLAKALAVFQAASQAGHDIGGWADHIKRGWLANIPYRSNLEAGSLDRKNPGHILRALYRSQMDAVARGRR